jgi:hypothetical protein
MIPGATVCGLKQLVGENNLEYKLIILIITLSFLCPLNQAQQKNSNEDYSNYSSDSIGAYYGPKVGILTMKFIADASHYLLKSIRVYSGNKLIQNIIVNKIIEKQDFRLVDYNYDGYKDITAVATYGSGGTACWIWNYSPKDRKFYYNKLLSDSLGLVLDPDRKQISIYNHKNNSEYDVNTYKYQNDKLVLIRCESYYHVMHGSAEWSMSSLTRWIDKKWVTKIDSTKNE